MCGRFALAVDINELKKAYGINPEDAKRCDLSPRYNIAPSQEIIGVCQTENGIRKLNSFRWGLIPHWAKDSSIGTKMINARAETVGEKPSFRAAFRSRRCLIPASAFYEWVRSGKEKIPYCIRHRDKTPMTFAGIWESWNGPDGPLHSCSILTTSANKILEPIHQRMPIILSAETFDPWLDRMNNNPDKLTPLLRPCAEDLLEAYRVDQRVNNPRNNGPECFAPYE